MGRRGEVGGGRGRGRGRGGGWGEGGEGEEGGEGGEEGEGVDARWEEEEGEMGECPIDWEETKLYTLGCGEHKFCLECIRDLLR